MEEDNENAVLAAKASGAYVKALRAHDAACKRHGIYPRGEFNGPVLVETEYDLIRNPNEDWDAIASVFASRKP